MAGGFLMKKFTVVFKFATKYPKYDTVTGVFDNYDEAFNSYQKISESCENFVRNGYIQDYEIAIIESKV